MASRGRAERLRGGGTRPVAASHRHRPSPRRFEVARLDPLRDLLAHLRALLVCGPEMDAAPDPRTDDLLDCVREALEVPLRDGDAGERPARDDVELDLVPAEEVRE